MVYIGGFVEKLTLWYFFDWKALSLGSFLGSMTILVHILNGLLGSVYLMFVVGNTNHALFTLLGAILFSTVLAIMMHAVRVILKVNSTVVFNRWSVQRNAWTLLLHAILFISSHVACIVAGQEALNGRQ